MTLSKYKAEWKPFARNREFWEEVLLEQRIIDITWDDKGISGLVLDSGEVVTIEGIEKGRLSIVDTTEDGDYPINREVSNEPLADDTKDVANAIADAEIKEHIEKVDAEFVDGLKALQENPLPIVKRTSDADLLRLIAHRMAMIPEDKEWLWKAAPPEDGDWRERLLLIADGLCAPPLRNDRDLKTQLTWLLVRMLCYVPELQDVPEEKRGAIEYHPKMIVAIVRNAKAMIDHLMHGTPWMVPINGEKYESMLDSVIKIEDEAFIKLAKGITDAPPDPAMEAVGKAMAGLLIDGVQAPGVTGVKLPDSDHHFKPHRTGTPFTENQYGCDTCGVARGIHGVPPADAEKRQATFTECVGCGKEIEVDGPPGDYMCEVCAGEKVKRR